MTDDLRIPVQPPRVVLGEHVDGGLAPALAAIVERGVRRRPALASTLQLEVELVIDGPYPPIRVEFGPRVVLVEDRAALEPALRVEGSLADLVSLMTAPIGIGGVPSLVRTRGRAALGKVAFGRVRVEGRIGQLRQLLALLRF